MFGAETARFNSTEYINWLKASYCLKLLKEGLHPFITHQIKGFHTDLLNRNCRLKEPCENFCRTRGTTLSSPCWACSEWKKVILSHHRQREKVTVNWGNCSPPQWRTDSWELAKAYLPRGYSEAKAIVQCDASALLNLINFCDCFHSVNVDCVRQVIRCRNTLMHSAEFSVEDEWMRQYRSSLKSLVQQFSHVPEMEAAGRRIQQVLDANVSVFVTDGEPPIHFQSLSSELEVGAELISQWEKESLQERLQELLRAAADEDEDEDESEKQDAECLKRLAGFLCAHADLADAFSAELQLISSMETEESEGKARKKLKTK